MDSIGFGESYMAGEWESTDIVGLLTVLAPALNELVPSGLRWLAPIAFAAQSRLAASEPGAGSANVAAHYDDVSNDLFVEFLDETMTYSSALFDHLPASWAGLAEAQRTQDRPTAGCRCGGARHPPAGTRHRVGRAVYPRSRARRRRPLRHPFGSPEVAGPQRIAAAGKSDRARVDLCDYRDIDGHYHAVISVETVETVGHRSWPDFLRTLGRLVKPGGRVAIQAITMPHARYVRSATARPGSRRTSSPADRSRQPKPSAPITQRDSTLRLFDMVVAGDQLRGNTATLAGAIDPTPEDASHIGFDEIFARMWERYLVDREAGFRSGHLNVYQWTFVNQSVP